MRYGDARRQHFVETAIVSMIAGMAIILEIRIVHNSYIALMRALDDYYVSTVKVLS